jgi:hypothetical protein
MGNPGPFRASRASQNKVLDCYDFIAARKCILDFLEAPDLFRAFLSFPGFSWRRYDLIVTRGCQSGLPAVPDQVQSPYDLIVLGCCPPGRSLAAGLITGLPRSLEETSDQQGPIAAYSCRDQLNAFGSDLVCLPMAADPVAGLLPSCVAGRRLGSRSASFSVATGHSWCETMVRLI